MLAQSLYVHFPFCETKCHYCDFYSIGRDRVRDGDANRFEEALRRECELSAASLAPRLSSLFFGGGTPSMTPPESMARALEPLRLGERMTPDTEWTMEANPSSVDVGRLKAYRAIGVNRVSMGVQAMRDDLLARLGRVHSRDKALVALESIFEAGFSNVSVDLLCGVPGQGLEDIDAAIGELARFPITHLSCYLLTLPKHHRMAPELPDEETQLAHLRRVHERLTGLGFEHYEVSNFARPGHRARHNLMYWKGGSYLGLGPSAHSFDAGAGRRWKNISSLHSYAARLEAGEPPLDMSETLTPEQLRLERWMLALRLDDGFPRDWLDTPLRQARSRSLADRGLLEAHPGSPERMRLTAEGFYLSDQVIASLA